MTWTYELAPNLAAVRPAAIEFRRWAGLRTNESVAADCELALVEACNNLIQHNATPEIIVIEAEATATEIILKIRDATRGFDWPLEPKLPEGISEEGRGIYLIHALMTAVEYTRNQGWNELRLRRRL